MKNISVYENWQITRKVKNLDYVILHKEGQHTTRGPRPARKEQIFSFLIAFLIGIWPARQLKRRNVARGRK